MKTTQNLIQKFFTGKNGKVVIWQTPNILLLGWLVFMILAKMLSQGDLKTGAQYLSFGLILIWAFMEILRGDSYFRRGLGLVVLILTVKSHI
jgi:hypothetical protein